MTAFTVLGHVMGDLKIVPLEPGDVLVIEMQRRITREQAEQIMEQIRGQLGERPNPILILAPEMKASWRPAGLDYEWRKDDA